MGWAKQHFVCPTESSRGGDKLQGSEDFGGYFFLSNGLQGVQQRFLGSGGLVFLPLLSHFLRKHCSEFLLHVLPHAVVVFGYHPALIFASFGRRMSF
eukprot:jgi/Pico_ML_1/54875/g731.t1